MLLCQQLRDAPSDWPRLSFAFPGRKWFHMLSCHSRPDRRGHIRRITHRPWLLRSSQCCFRFPALRLGRPRTAWPGDTAFPCSAFDTGEVRSALLHRQFCECTPGHVRRPRSRLPALLAPALNSLVWLGSLSRCLRAFNSLTVFSYSSASPGVEVARFATLPGRLHTSDSSSDFGAAHQTHASVEYLRTHAGLGPDCSSQAVPIATSCHN